MHLFAFSLLFYEENTAKTYIKTSDSLAKSAILSCEKQSSLLLYAFFLFLYEFWNCVFRSISEIVLTIEL